ncbi:MAG: hypothetical protein ABIQ35_15700 [Verrucomicrobiota bacterium]
MKRTIHVIMLGCFFSFYFLSYFYRWEIGLVKPSANLRYFYFSDSEPLEQVFYVTYYPLYRINYWFQKQNGIPNEVYFSERTD